MRRLAQDSPLPFRTLTILALVALAALAACRMTPEAESEFLVEVQPGSFFHYAWLGEAVSERSEFDADIHLAIEAQMLRLGQARTDLDEADYFITYDTTIRTEQRKSDPYATTRVGELVEIGTLTIQLLDVRTGEPFWRGSQSGKLRRSAVLYGGIVTNNYTPTDAPREWNIDDRVEEILTPLKGRL